MSEKGGAKKQEISRWEWVVAGIGAALVVGTIGYLVVQALTVPDGPPRIDVAIDSIAPAPAGHTVEFTATNAGHSTASGVVIRAELRDGESVLEEGSVTFDYLPAGDTRSAAFVFSRDPREYRLEIGAQAYQRP